MPYDPDKHHRRSIRLQDYDYTQPGAYFVTICTHNHECLFGQVIGAEMHLSNYGQIAHDEWTKTAVVRSYVTLDAFIIMPNHVHGIIIIVGTWQGTRRRRVPTRPTSEAFSRPVPGSLPTIIRSYKSTVTRQINDLRHTPGSTVWQGRFYEHIVRDDDDLHRIREYIINNPARWEYDRYHPTKFL